MLRDGISSGALDDIFLGGSGSLGGSPGGVGLGGLNGKLMGSGVGTNPLAAIFAASNTGGIPSPAGIQQVCTIFGVANYRCRKNYILHSFSYCLNYFFWNISGGWAASIPSCRWIYQSIPITAFNAATQPYAVSSSGNFKSTLWTNKSFL